MSLTNESFTSWEKLLGPSTLVVTSLGSIFLNLLIIVGAFRTKNLRLLGTFLALQMALLDLVFSLWGIGWFGVKMIDPTHPFSTIAVQFEGAILYSAFFAWFTSALLLTCHSYLEKTNFRPRRKIHSALTWLQYFLWIVPIIVCSCLGANGMFDVMPSGSYCGSPYSPGSLNSQILSISFVAAIFLPILISAYFYIVILSCKNSHVRELIEAPDPVYLPRNYPFKPPSSTSLNKLKKGVSDASSSQHRAALLAVAYPLIFFLSFLPSAIVVIRELVTDQPRSASSDAIVFAISTLYKLLTPVLTIRTHSTIRNQVLLFLRIKPTSNQPPPSLPSP